MFKVVPSVQNYAWGKVGEESMVAQIGAHGDIQPEKPYAELWMGTHANGECAGHRVHPPRSVSPRVLSYAPTAPTKVQSGALLSDWMASNPDQAGGMAQLPFLFKVLSVRTALSIQAHPDKVRRWRSAAIVAVPQFSVLRGVAHNTPGWQSLHSSSSSSPSSSSSSAAASL